MSTFLAYSYIKLIELRDLTVLEAPTELPKLLKFLNNEFNIIYKPWGFGVLGFWGLGSG